MSEIDENEVLEDLYQQPQLMMQIVEKSLLVAENLRGNYYRNTARFITHLRQAMKRDSTILQTFSVKDATWEEFQNELGRVDICGIMVICPHSPYLIHNGQK